MSALEQVVRLSRDGPVPQYSKPRLSIVEPSAERPGRVPTVFSAIASVRFTSGWTPT
jgi:hypothetical protein